MCLRLFYNKVAGLDLQLNLKKSLAQVFSCEFCEIFKNKFSYRTPPVVASKIFFSEYIYVKHIPDTLQLYENKPIWKYIQLPKTSLD